MIHGLCMTVCVCVSVYACCRHRQRERVVTKVGDKHSFSALIASAVGTSCGQHTHRAAKVQTRPSHKATQQQCNFEQSLSSTTLHRHNTRLPCTYKEFTDMTCKYERHISSEIEQDRHFTRWFGHVAEVGTDLSLLVVLESWRFLKVERNRREKFGFP